jgi:hypothetical protein
MSYLQKNGVSRTKAEDAFQTELVAAKEQNFLQFTINKVQSKLFEEKKALQSCHFKYFFVIAQYGIGFYNHCSIFPAPCLIRLISSSMQSTTVEGSIPP